MRVKIKKRGFILVEILLSIALVSICLFPLIQPLFLELKKERELVHKFQFEMIAKNSFLEIKKTLHEQNKSIHISFDKGISGELSPIKITGEKGDMTVNRSYQISVLQSYDKRTLKSNYYLCEIEINLSLNRHSQIFSYTTFIQEKREA